MNIDQNSFFREVTLRISSSLEVGEALANLCDYLKTFIPFESIILTYRGKDGGFYMVAKAGDPIPFLKDVNPYEPTLFLDDSDIEFFEANLFNFVLQVGSTRILLPEGKQKMLQMMLKHYPNFPPTFACTLQTILAIHGEIIGELVLTSSNDGGFSIEHAALLESVKEPITIAMSNARRYLDVVRLKDLLADDNREIRRELYAASGDQVIGAEFGLRRVMELVRDVAHLNSPVLLLGETGTGKEVIANAIHQNSPRREKPFVRVQCGAIPNTLLDSELFGHEKGAFTGALSQKRGRFERADGGTIFLDEIGELTLDAQVKLLRVLQEKEIERLGGSETIKLDVRVIAATHRDLEKMVAEGSFREDLYFRLNVFPIFLPPLRQRREDIPVLTVHFVNKKSREMGLVEYPIFGPDAISQLTRYDWPGNVRELQNIIERALITCRGKPLSFPALGNPIEVQQPPPAVGGSESEPIDSLDDAIAQQIRRALTKAKGKIHGRGGAAEILGMNASTLRYQMQKHGIPFGRQS